MSSAPAGPTQTSKVQDARKQIDFSKPPAAHVIVGRERQSFYIHKEGLIGVSPVFAAALNGSFLEATTQEIKLPEDDPSIVEIFVQWLYFDKVLDNSNSSNSGEFNSRLYIALDVFCFGDKIGCPEFGDLAIKGLHGLRHQMKYRPSRDLIEHLYAPTFPSGPDTAILRVGVVTLTSRYLLFQEKHWSDQQKLDEQAEVMAFRAEFVADLVSYWVRKDDIWSDWEVPLKEVVEETGLKRPEGILAWIRSRLGSWWQARNFGLKLNFNVNFGYPLLMAGGWNSEEDYNNGWN